MNHDCTNCASLTVFFHLISEYPSPPHHPQCFPNGILILRLKCRLPETVREVSLLHWFYKGTDIYWERTLKTTEEEVWTEDSQFVHGYIILGVFLKGMRFSSVRKAKRNCSSAVWALVWGMPQNLNLHFFLTSNILEVAPDRRPDRTEKSIVINKCHLWKPGQTNAHCHYIDSRI